MMSENTPKFDTCCNVPDEATKLRSYYVFVEKITEDSPEIKNFIEARLRQFKLNGRFTYKTVLSDVYIRTIARIASGKTLSDPGAWIKSVAYNRIREIHREQSKYQPWMEDYSVEAFDQCDDSADFVKAYLPLLTKEIDKLDPKERRLLHWFYFQQKSWKEIAAILSEEENKVIQESTVRKRAERIRKKLRETMELQMSCADDNNQLNQLPSPKHLLS